MAQFEEFLASRPDLDGAGWAAQKTAFLTEAFTSRVRAAQAPTQVPVGPSQPPMPVPMEGVEEGGEEETPQVSDENLALQHRLLQEQLRYSAYQQQQQAQAQAEGLLMAEQAEYYRAQAEYMEQRRRAQEQMVSQSTEPTLQDLNEAARRDELDRLMEAGSQAGPASQPMGTAPRGLMAEFDEAGGAVHSAGA